jgi:hypothetical protein
MLRDPELTGDTLLFALCLREVINRREWDRALKIRTSTTGGALREVTEMAIGRPDTSLWWSKRIIADDIPRYEIPAPPGVVCGAPMIRREGLCGKKTSRSIWADRDPITGVQTWIGFCHRHYTLDVEREQMRRTAAWQSNGKPSPGPNTGGVLKRYFSTDWNQWYTWAASWRTPLEGPRTIRPPKPSLQLIEGGKTG